MRITDELLQRRLARDGLASQADMNLTAQELALANCGTCSARLKVWHEAQALKPAPLRDAS